MQYLMDHAAALPVEYQADLVLGVIDEAPDKLTTHMRQELVRSLLERSTKATYPFGTVVATDNYGTVNNQIALDLHWLRLDGLDIAVRSIAAGKQSAATSLNWLSQFPTPVARASCSDSLTPDVRPYYRLLMQLVGANPTTSYPDGLTRVDYLVETAHQLKSPAQLSAFMDSFGSLQLTQEDVALIVQTLVSQMDAMDASDREITGAEGFNGDISQAVRKMLTVANMSPPLDISLLNAYRRFLIRGLHGHACADFTVSRRKEAERFNSLSAVFIGDPPRPVHGLAEKELTAAAFDPGAPQEKIDLNLRLHDKLHAIFQVSTANQRASYVGGNDPALLQPEPSDVSDVLQEVRRFEESDAQSRLAIYENRQAVLALLIELLPPGDSFHDAVDAEAAFLNLNSIEDSSPTSWLRVLKNLILISRPVTPDVRADLQAKVREGKRLIMMPSIEGPFIRQTLRRYESDKIIATYLEFEDVFVPTYKPFKPSGN